MVLEITKTLALRATHLALPPLQDHPVTPITKQIPKVVIIQQIRRSAQMVPRVQHRTKVTKIHQQISVPTRGIFKIIRPKALALMSY